MNPNGPPPDEAAKSRQNPDKSSQHQNNQALSSSPAPPPQKHICAPSEHNNDINLQQKCVTCVQQNLPSIPDDLAEVVQAWDVLPDEVKSGIVAMVKAVRKKPETNK